MTNDYLGNIIDTNKSEEGTETTVLGENNMNKLDCRKALVRLKMDMRKNDRGRGTTE